MDVDQSPPQRADSADPTHVLREYAVLADGERGILVGPRGDFGWMCFPRWDSPAIFADLLGGGGSYVVTPEGRYVWGGYYEERSLIWNSRWVTENGVIECREALALPTRRDRAVVLRRLSAVAGSPSLRIVLDVRGDYGRAGAGDVHRGDDGTWHIATAGAHLRWSGAPDARVETDSPGRPVLALALRLAEGEQHDLVLDIATDTVVEATASAEDAWARTEAEWRRRVPEIGHTVAPRDAQHSYAVLSGLTSAGGGMVAAATTSLPERANAGRSYDYRYVWIRDQCYAGQAAARAGHPALLDSATRFVQERLLSDGPQLMPAYTTSGGPVPSQTHLGLPGYPGGSDVVGNHVNAQFQLDALGEALLLFAAAARGDRLEADGWQAVQVAIDAIGQRWSEPEAGIWELDPRRWTHSRLICAAGLQAIGRFLDAGNITGPAWRALAGGLVDDATRHGLHPSGRWQRAYDDERVDAALLLAGIRGAVAADDPRTLATLRAVEADLTEDGYCYRYRPDERPLGEAEGAFLLCGFIMSLAYEQQGDTVRAARWFERNRAACGPPGLCSEEFDVRQRQLRGNLPQAFVHALLLECAARQGETVDGAGQS